MALQVDENGELAEVILPGEPPRELEPVGEENAAMIAAALDAEEARITEVLHLENIQKFSTATLASYLIQ